MRCHLQISSYRIDLVSVNGPISPKQCYYEMDYSFYSFYWLDSLQIRLDHNSTYYRPLSKNSDVKPRISHCDSQNLQYKTHPEFWPSHRRIFKTSLYYKTRLILETRRYIGNSIGRWNWNIPGKLDHYYGCWCPGALCRQVISNNGLDCRIYRPLSLGCTCLHQLSVENDRKCEFLCVLK